MVIWKGQTATTGFNGGGEETPISAVMPGGMEIPPSETLDMNESLHLTIDYLLRVEYGNLEFQID